MTTRNPRSALAGLIGWLALCFAVAALGAVASANAPAFYASLSKPDWAPPAGVFGPVWSTLYFLMAIAAWLAWRKVPLGSTPLNVFLAQLVANALWSWLFFAWRLGAASFVEVIALWLLIVATVVAFWRVSRLAALLLLPYLAWVSFASALTFSVWQRNPSLLG